MTISQNPSKRPLNLYLAGVYGPELALLGGGIFVAET